MRIQEWSDFEQNGLGVSRSAAITIGVFDGVHKGHKALLDKVLSVPGDWERTVITFKQNPKLLLHPENYHGAISTLAQKLESLEETGIGTCVLIDFSGNFSKLTGIAFLSTLADKGRVRYLAVGTDFRCGHRLSTNAEGVRIIGASMGVDTEIVDPVLYNGRAVSSSRIRRAVQDGRLPDAFAMLSRPYVIDLRDFVPKKLDGEMQFDGIRQVLPPPGEYVIEVLNGKEWLKTSLNVLSPESARIATLGGDPPRFLRFTDIR